MLCSVKRERHLPLGSVGVQRSGSDTKLECAKQASVVPTWVRLFVQADDGLDKRV
jgi:hypothetical protein